MIEKINFELSKPQFIKEHDQASSIVFDKSNVELRKNANYSSYIEDKNDK